MRLVGDYMRELYGDKTTQTVRWLAVLAAHLPTTSRVAVAANPDNAWTTSDYLLRNIEYQLRAFTWAFAGGEKVGPRPEPIYSPGESADYESMVDEAVKMASNVAAVLGIEGG